MFSKGNTVVEKNMKVKKNWKEKQLLSLELVMELEKRLQEILLQEALEWLWLAVTWKNVKLYAKKLLWNHQISMSTAENVI